MSRYIAGHVIVLAYDMAERVMPALECIESVTILDRYGAIELVKRSYYHPIINPNAVQDTFDLMGRLARLD